MPAQKNLKTAPVATRSNPAHSSYRRIALVFVVLAVILILGVSYLALSKVTISLTPANKTINYDFTLTLADNPQNSSSTSAILPAKIMSEQSAVEQEFPVAQGSMVDGQAQGTVTIYNNRNSSQTLIATTRLLTPDGKIFRLKDKVILPANSSLQAKIQADEKGAGGNIPATSFTIPGLSESLQKLVYAKSSAAMTGGTRQIGVLTASDIEKAKLELSQSSSAGAIAKFAASLNDKSLLLIDSQSKLAETKADQEVGSEVSSFTLFGQLAVAAVFAKQEEILELAKNKFKESNGAKNEFVNVDPSSLSYQLIAIDEKKLEAEVKVKISGLATLDPEKDIFDKNLLVGFTENDLKLYFSQFESIKDAQVKFSPFWIKKVPILKDHIIIKIEK
ncbi:hypothetical protein A3B87_03290 [Candidatus Kuenenbacteria bacterium RIFCSPHIGHO2_02_FULL_39_13]|uniref:Baseplate protein J-like domain-containing protein n=1 Tax=Candidatus Kuenenbacteria bacterium RIFCSPHIGHO2_02_FULL_39_13 TaxID=1798561 RepID=A0A1F6FLB4_9BACT|nr:MAG: hypothetical protein A3B87_03290 [Candidatus Kuenenbacteria bacterium RIFCSPHIGHO2_02_FULL_39_13]